MWLSTISMDRFLEGFDRALGLSHLPILVYLAFVFTIILIASALLYLASRARMFNLGEREGGFLFKVVMFIVLSNIILLLVGVITSLESFHYSSAMILAILLVPVAVYLAVLAGGRVSGINMVLLVMVVVVVFVFGSRHIVTGIEEGETTSDMINIYLNGYFRWSIHGDHYDLAPLDAVLKVMLGYVAGGSIYDALLASITYSSYGLAVLLLLYTLARMPSNTSTLAVAVVVLSTLSYPYSPIIGLSVPPAPHAHLLAVMASAVIAKPLLGHGSFNTRDYVVVSLLVTSSTLIHPSTLAFPIYLAILALLLYIRGDTVGYRRVVYILLLALALHLLKIMYTAWTTGFLNYVNLLWNYIVNAFTREELTTITTRNPGYSSLPRLSLTGFAVLPGFLAGLALTLLLRVLRGGTLSFVEKLLLATVTLYAVFATASLLTGVGGVSQSRIVFNGVQPYMELVLILYLSYLLKSSNGIGRLLMLTPLLLASMSTLVTPNALPLNYTIPMAKPATINDHIIAYKFTGLVDKGYYASLYNSCGDLGRIVAEQSRGDFYYGLGSTMAGVYYFIAPGHVHAKSYWDPCIMAIGRVPEDTEGYTTNRVFDAWVYEFNIYARS